MNGSPAPPPPVVVTLRRLMETLLTRWRAVAVTTIMGALLGAALSTVLLGGSATANTTILLVHDVEEDPGFAIQTDVGLFATRSFADDVAAKLGSMSTADVLKSVNAEPVTPRLVRVTASATTEAEAEALADAASNAFLELRGELQGRDFAATAADQQRQVDEMDGRIEELSAEIDRLTRSSGNNASRIETLLVQRSGLQSDISAIGQSLRSDETRLASIVDGSVVVDTADAEQSSPIKVAVLGVVVGGVLGFFGAAASVAALSLLSSRPTRRDEVAAAVSAPVIISVDAVARRGRRARGARSLAAVRLADEMLDDPESRWAILGVATDREALAVAEAVMRELDSRSVAVTGVDLTPSGGLARSLGTEAAGLGADQSAVPTPSGDGFVVLRPSATPQLARRPRDWDTGDAGPNRTLVVAEITPRIGAEHLATWADVAVLVVRAGKVPTDHLHSVGKTLGRAGFAVVMVALVGTDRRDPSDGESLPERSWLGATDGTRRTDDVFVGLTKSLAP
jgi:capsular polysaccharide biosynthesis protein